jgi:hypothetical protein
MEDYLHPLFKSYAKMIKTKIALKKDEIPSSWIFEHYAGLQDKLYGQNIKIKSVFNPKEKTPSMFIYLGSDMQYRFKDFSSGYSGDACSFVSRLYGITYAKAINRVVKDFNYANLSAADYVIDPSKSSAYQVFDYEARNWNSIDAKYWTSFGIGSKMLEKFNVMPLHSYKLGKENDIIHVERPYMYGYFNNEGLLYKIYQPKNKSKKFLKVRNCIQGMDQLTFKKPNLVIHSSLKDLMAFEELKFKTIECIAPDSENSRIPEKIMWELIKKYERVITVFDNDEAGMKAVERYKEMYGIDGFALDMEKDVADSVAKYGKEPVKLRLVSLLTERINTCKRCNEIITLA